MATHSGILAWRIPWTEEPGGLQSIGLRRVRHADRRSGLSHHEEGDGIDEEDAGEEDVAELTQEGRALHSAHRLCSHLWQTLETHMCAANSKQPNKGKKIFPPALKSGSAPHLLQLKPLRTPGLGALFRFRHSGSPQRHRLGWACVLRSSQVRAAQVMRCLASANVVTYRLPATRLSGCKTGAPSTCAGDLRELLRVPLRRH